MKRTLARRHSYQEYLGPSSLTKELKQRSHRIPAPHNHPDPAPKWPTDLPCPFRNAKASKRPEVFAIPIRTRFPANSGYRGCRACPA